MTEAQIAAELKAIVERHMVDGQYADVPAARAEMIPYLQELQRRGVLPPVELPKLSLDIQAALTNQGQLISVYATMRFGTTE